MNRRTPLLAAVLALLAVFTLNPGAQAVTYSAIAGTGSSWSYNIVRQWMSDVNANGITVDYTPNGSTQGRKDFANYTNDFAISEIPYQGVDESGQVDKSDRPYAYLPIVAGGTAFTYQLKIGNTMVRNLRLSGETLTKIFTNQITNWNDPQIKKENGGRTFPNLAITPVVRADGSGTTAQFTAWMADQYGSLWKAYSGRSGLTSFYPKKGRMLGAAGSDQVMNQIAASTGNGTIGYIEYSYPLNKTAADGKPFPVVKVLNKGGYYVEPTEYNVAVALTKARIRTDLPQTDPMYLTQDLRGVYTFDDPRAYPISSYSYMIIPVSGTDRTMTTAKRQALSDFLFYGLCSGQSKAGPYGYSPLPLNLVQAGFDQVKRLATADPKVDLTNKDVRSCGNPTFDGKNPNRNVLAAKAPMPAACDKATAAPCGTDTGTNTPSTDDKNAPTAGGASTAPAAGAAAPVAGAVDPETGAVAAAAGASSGEPVTAAATQLSSDRPGEKLPFAVVASGELIALVAAPGLFAAYLRRRKGAL
ncbi:phosphate ABC transporter substrate-binding protein PstS [Nocardioides jiangxiensis]|uniref:Phosphate ABC transporter substrate-binding protein PstS n=1 Tax=Nocardioides jiangxiensis TaxID=3064524 RepID=A0ABT9B3I1_9ACTN|nr:phosphate ABC transporter substrate-binding protein PstS [Nocardioides sp. WY-20]MDO7868798.1 phosphate ABC transporter substrate-binding protein PstS [Nocardioides sp. WY-20]